MEMTNTEVEKLIENLNSGTLEQRKTAAVKLGNYPVKEAMLALVSAFHDENTSVRFLAKRSFNKIKNQLDKKSSEIQDKELFTILKEEENHQKIKEVLAKILKSKNRKYISSLKKLLKKQKDINIKIEIAKTIARLGEQSERAYFFKMLESEHIDSMKVAIAALGELEDRTVYVQLEKYIDDKRYEVALRAIRALWEYAPSKCCTKLKNLLYHRDEKVVKMAIATLECFDNDRALRLLLPLKNAKNKNISRYALKAYENIQKRRAGLKKEVDAFKERELTDKSKRLKIAINKLTSAQFFVRLSAVVELGKLAGEDNLPIIKEICLNEENNLIRSKLLILIDRLGGRREVDFIKKFVDTKDEKLKEVVKDILSKYKISGKRSSTKILDSIVERGRAPDKFLFEQIENLFSGDRQTKLEALNIISFVGNNEIANDLLEALSNEKDVMVKATIIKTLARLNCKEALPEITSYLNDEDSRIRANTIEALDILKDPQIEEKIVPFLYDIDNRVKTNAIKALWRIDSERAIIRLEKMAHSPDIWARKSAIYALSEIKEEDSLFLLTHLCNDADIEVSAAAYEVFTKLSYELSKSVEKKGEYKERLISLEDLKKEVEEKEKQKFKENKKQEENITNIQMPAEIEKTKIQKLERYKKSVGKEVRKKVAEKTKISEEKKEYTDKRKSVSEKKQSDKKREVKKSENVSPSLQEKPEPSKRIVAKSSLAERKVTPGKAHKKKTLLYRKYNLIYFIFALLLLVSSSLYIYFKYGDIVSVALRGEAQIKIKKKSAFEIFKKIPAPAVNRVNIEVIE